MNYIAGSDRTEALLLPEVLDDYIAPENPVRFIDAFVGQLDLRKAGFTNAQLQETGRPPYDPGDLLRLYLYGYLNRVRSSRGLAAQQRWGDQGGGPGIYPAVPQAGAFRRGAGCD